MRRATNSLSAAVLAAGIGLAACSPPEGTAPVPDPALRQTPSTAPDVELSESAEATRQKLMDIARRDSLSELARLAASESGFVSNTAGAPHREYWDLMRRIGVHPNGQLEVLLQGKPGQRAVNGEIWYVWPDLAARSANDLIPEKLSFQDRRRLEQLVGDQGIARIRSGEGYPGMRTAIAHDGRWVYFVLGLEEQEIVE